MAIIAVPLVSFRYVKNKKSAVEPIVHRMDVFYQ